MYASYHHLFVRNRHLKKNPYIIFLPAAQTRPKSSALHIDKKHGTRPRLVTASKKYGSRHNGSLHTAKELTRR